MSILRASLGRTGTWRIRCTSYVLCLVYVGERVDLKANEIVDWLLDGVADVCTEIGGGVVDW